jgi:MFS family permease
MVAQAFFYNAIFFTYGLVLMRFYGVPAERTGTYLLPLAIGNVLGPLVIGHLFDTVGRKPMIVITYAVSGVLLALSGWMFREGMLTAQTQTLAWAIIFFVASAAASSAYLTVSEIFPLEIRALAIAIFYSVVFGGYLFGAALMLIAASVEAWIGVKAERQSLESIAMPLSSRS